MITVNHGRSIRADIQLVEATFLVIEHAVVMGRKCLLLLLLRLEESDNGSAARPARV